MGKTHLQIEDVLRIGKVTAVKGRTVEVLVDRSKNGSHLLYEGTLIKNISVGSYVKITKGFESFIGKIEGEQIAEDRIFTAKEYANPKDKIKRILNLKLLGYLEKGRFKQGIKDLPLIDNECFLVSKEEFSKIHYFIKEIDGELDKEIQIGHLANEKGKEVVLGINSLFASHIGIFGNTGSGKSYTLSSLYHQLFNKYKNQEAFKLNAKFLLIDFNGEYLKTEGEDNIIVENSFKSTYNLSTRKRDGDKFPISQSEIDDDDFWSIFLTATEKTQKPFLKRALNNDFYFDRFDTLDNFKYCLHFMLDKLIQIGVEKGNILQFLRYVSQTLGGNSSIENIHDNYNDSLYFHSGDNNNYFFRDNFGNQIYYNRPEFDSVAILAFTNQISIDLSQVSHLQKIRLRIVFEFYDEIAKYDLNTEHINPLIKRLKKIEELDKIITISSSTATTFLEVISLADVNTEMKKIVPLLICKQVYDKKKRERDGSKYLNIIIDEAHNILSYSSQRESETWKDYRLETFEEIIKEGRKFGVFLTLASQRPSDISATIISQLHNYFLHRLINNKDIEAVEKTISYLDKVSFESLPILPTGTCVLAGLSAQVPLIVEMNAIEEQFEPYNKTIKPTDFWE
ncbi:ATP-binding protein [Roseivirga pacifica]|uniref:ATP-binding protein n=1 Tax=Roseivirga pacifica TaxID=1267423 RepID=UPI003BAEF0B0